MSRLLPTLRANHQSNFSLLVATLVPAALGLALMAASACTPTRTTGYENWPTNKGTTGTTNQPRPVMTDQEEIDLLYTRALEAARRRDYIEAKVTLKRITNREPWHLAAHQTYQDIMLKEDRFEEVHAEYLHILGDAPDQGEALWLYMRVMLSKRPRTGDDSAQANPDQAAKLSLAYQEALSAMPDIPGALKSLEPVIAAQPFHIAGHRLYQDLVLSKDGESALPVLMKRYQMLRDELQISGDAVYLFERVASLDDPVESCLRYARAITEDLQGYWLYYGFGRLAAERAAASDNDNEKLALLRLSRDLYGVSIRTNELVWEAYYGRGIAHQALGDLKEARSDLNFALSLMGDAPDEDLILTLAEIEDELGNIELAFGHYIKGNTLFPRNPWFVYGAAGIAADDGKFEMAAEFYEAAYKLFDDDDETRALISEWLKQRVAEGKIKPREK